MLKILFLNDGTGDPPEIIGNYRWKVMLNDQTLAEGTLKDHNRLTGWEGLVMYFAETLEKKLERKKKREAKRSG